jgi:hypothetical protein
VNDTPGRPSPGSARPDGDGAGVPGPAEPAEPSGPASKWSSSQPPPGHWSAPDAPSANRASVPSPTPGWGAPPQRGWGGAPPAAKPGVIPLRPMSLGEILDGSVATLRAHWRTVLGITITISVISEFVTILGLRFLAPEPPGPLSAADDEEAVRQALDDLQTSLVALGPVILVSLIATIFTTALLTVVVSRAVLGKPVTFAEAWREARPQLLRMVGLTVLLPAAAVAIVMVALLPALLLGGATGGVLVVMVAAAALTTLVWLMVRFALAPPALMLERQGVIASLRRSAKLVEGAWWRVFGTLVLMMVLTTLVAMIIGLPFGIMAVMLDSGGVDAFLNGETDAFSWTYLIVTGVGTVIASAITYPISAGVIAILYVDQRIRREALDLELARAAGVPGYGTGPSDAAPGN